MASPSPAGSLSWRVTLFADRNWGGASQSISGSATDYRASLPRPFNDRASSAVVQAPAHLCVCFNQNADGTGLAKCWNADAARPSNFAIDGINDVISAVSVYRRSDSRCILSRHTARRTAATYCNGCWE